MSNTDNEEVYNQHVLTELTDEEVRKVDEWMEKSDEESIDYFFEQVVEYGAREAAKHVYILDDEDEKKDEDSFNSHDRKCIVLCGSISDGFEAYGPFDSFDAADEAMPSPDTWIMTLKAPKVA